MSMKVNGTELNNRVLTWTLGLCAVLLSAMAGPLAYAGAPEQAKADVAFQALDQDKDGKLTAIEAKGNVELGRRWTEIDQDDNGTIDEVEFSAFEAMPPKGE
jgi:Ca2+-binding EF-hand superfamily protein